MTVALSGCPSTFPKVTRCILGDAGCICYDPKTDRDFDLTFKECENYIATDIDSYNQVSEWIQRNCKK